MTAGEVIATLILKCGISPDYVLDEMPLYLVDLLLSHAYIIDQAAAERMRLMCWMTAQVNSKKPLKPEDIITFSWEREAERDTEEMTPERWAKLQHRAQQMRQNIKKNG